MSIGADSPSPAGPDASVRKEPAPPRWCELTIIAHDPSLRSRASDEDAGRILRASARSPYGTIGPGPRGVRFHIVGYDAVRHTLSQPHELQSGRGEVKDPFNEAPDEELLDSPAFHAQNVYAKGALVDIDRVPSRYRTAFKRNEWGLTREKEGGAMSMSTSPGGARHDGGVSNQEGTGQGNTTNAETDSVESTQEYTRRARLLPAILVGLPLAFTAVALFPSEPDWWKGLTGLLTSAAVAAFVANIARSQGVRKQDDLFRSWGGVPTTQLLRFRTAENKAQVAQFHTDVSTATGRILPDEASETKDPGAADQEYSVAVRKLRRFTDDRDRFAFVFNENVNYGFRRNLYGLRGLGIASALLGAIAAAVLAILASQDIVDGSVVAFSIAAAINVFIAAAWIFYVNAGWVREVAFSYGERLLEAAASIKVKSPPNEVAE